MAKNKNRRDQTGGRHPQERDTVSAPGEDRVESPSPQEPMQGPRGKRQKRFGHN